MQQKAFQPGRSNPYIPDGPRDFFIYPVNLGSLAVGVANTVIVPISSDSDFWLTGFTYQADIAAALQTDATRVIPLVTIQITDTGSGRQLLNAAAPISTFMGTGDRPYRLVHPRMFARRTSIQIQGTSYAVAGTVYAACWISLIGFKIYDA